MKTKMIYSASKEKNLERFGDNQNSCLCCGKPTKMNHWVHLLTTGELTDQESDPQSQGSFPIGPDCAKKLPSNFVVVEIF